MYLIIENYIANVFETKIFIYPLYNFPVLASKHLYLIGGGRSNLWEF